MRVAKGLVIKKYLNKLANQMNPVVDYGRQVSYTRAADIFGNMSNAEVDLCLGDNLDIDPIVKTKFIGPKIRAKAFKAMQDDALVISLENEVLAELKKNNPSNPHKHYMLRDEAIMKVHDIILDLDQMNIMHDVAGSYRREKEMVGDLDIIIQGAMPKREFFESYGQVSAYGSMKVKLILQDLEVDFRSCEEKSYPFMLLHFTGPASFNQWMRTQAKSRGFKLNEYGLFDLKTGQRVLGFFKYESDIFDFLGIKYVEPKDRF